MADHKELSLTDIVTETLSQRNKVYEPTESTRLYSVREMQKRAPRHIRHRFPFKGGISINDIITNNVRQANPLLRMLIDRKLYGDGST